MDKKIYGRTYSDVLGGPFSKKSSNWNIYQQKDTIHIKVTEIIAIINIRRKVISHKQQ
jgi:hypothetical protein